MHLRSALRWEEAVSGLHSPQDECQEALPVMDARAWQALTHLPACPQPLPRALAQHSPFTASWVAGEHPGAAPGWLVKAARSPAEISALFPL